VALEITVLSQVATFPEGEEPVWTLQLEVSDGTDSYQFEYEVPLMDAAELGDYLLSDEGLWDYAVANGTKIDIFTQYDPEFVFRVLIDQLLVVINEIQVALELPETSAADLIAAMQTQLAE
jgi:hypothetical protein